MLTCTSHSQVWLSPRAHLQNTLLLVLWGQGLGLQLSARVAGSPVISDRVGISAGNAGTD